MTSISLTKVGLKTAAIRRRRPDDRAVGWLIVAVGSVVGWGAIITGIVALVSLFA